MADVGKQYKVKQNMIGRGIVRRLMKPISPNCHKRIHSVRNVGMPRHIRKNAYDIYVHCKHVE